jgi:7,8-dihydro-6-hydroxymethylpterin-pyrophosphokinase
VSATAVLLHDKTLERQAWEAAQTSFLAALVQAHTRRAPRHVLKLLHRDARRVARQVEAARAREARAQLEAVS